MICFDLISFDFLYERDISVFAKKTKKRKSGCPCDLRLYISCSNDMFISDNMRRFWIQF